MPWLVVRTKSRRERWAAQNIEQQGCEYYLPCFEVLAPRNGRLVALKPKVLFPSYIFVNPPDGRWRFLLSTLGVQTLIMWGNETPAVMPEHEIKRLRGNERDGLVRLPDNSPAAVKFQINEKLRVKAGAFEDQYGLYAGMDDRGREKILLDVLGGRRIVLFDTDDIESVA